MESAVLRESLKPAHVPNAILLNKVRGDKNDVSGFQTPIDFGTPLWRAVLPTPPSACTPIGWEIRRAAPPSTPAVAFLTTFVLDSGATVGFAFHHLVAAQYDNEQLLIQWPPGTITITGPKALEFYKDFAKGKGTWIKADGQEILSVRFEATA